MKPLFVEADKETCVGRGSEQGGGLQWEACADLLTGFKMEIIREKPIHFITLGHTQSKTKAAARKRSSSTNGGKRP